MTGCYAKGIKDVKTFTQYFNVNHKHYSVKTHYKNFSVHGVIQDCKAVQNHLSGARIFFYIHETHFTLG